MNRPVLDDWIAEKIKDFGENKNAEFDCPEQKKTAYRGFQRHDLERYQLDRLNHTLRLAVQNSPFYRDRFGAAARLDSLSEIAELPFTTPEDLKADPYRLLCVHPNEISRIVTLRTSGSTGASKRVFFSEADLELCTDYFHHGMRNLVNEADTAGILFPHETPASVGDQLIKGLERLGAKTIPLYGLSKEEISASLEANGVTSLAGLPGQIADLAEGFPHHTAIKTVLLSADFVSDRTRETIRQIWHAEVFEHYGMTEMGLGCAVTCEHQRGYHVREADLYLEIVDPATGRPAADGEWGEIVFTTLTRVGMPFIRYRTGDYSRWKTDACSCGSRLKLLDYIRDRHAAKGKSNFY